MNRPIRELRIIGGQLRGRKLSFPDEAGLRPTPDRVRETLFNWLGPYIVGTRVLDLFAGSGALGLEALSRGAAAVTLVENSRIAVATLRATVARFAVESVRIETSDALAFLRSTGETYDVIFLDPPFAAGLLVPTLAQLAKKRVLAAGGFCYVECPRDAPLPPLPEGWVIHRTGVAGEVGYHLLHDPSRNLSRNI
jgi:16S rRNA (guanine966-N2)-methyltransferase